MRHGIVKSIKPILIRLYEQLTGTRAAGIYILVFAASIGIATFIENDFGTSSAQKLVYRSRWFEVLLLLFSLTLVANIIRFKMIRQKKWAILLFHISMIIILVGAGITRYISFEGMMHIREGSANDRFLSSENYLIFDAVDRDHRYQFDEPVLFASISDNNWEKTYQLGQHELDVEVVNFIPNPETKMTHSDDGLPTIKMVMGGASGRENYHIVVGEQKRIKGTLFNFSSEILEDAINITYQDQKPYISSRFPLTRTVMATQITDTLLPEHGPSPLQLRALYSTGREQFVFSEFDPSAKLEIVSSNQKVKNESICAVTLKLTKNGNSVLKTVYGRKGTHGRPASFRFEDMMVSVSYGAKYYHLPFQIYLYDFIMERYPGTNSASSYASEVQLRDPRTQYQQDYRIYMNNILNYDGYRFFQSSFDQDELGTYLSVNHDFWGTLVSYIGYFLLTLGMVMAFFTKNSRIYRIRKHLKQLRNRTQIVIIFLFGSFVSYTQSVIEPHIDAVTEQHADQFSKLVVQDFNGRMKPIHTLSRELVRKISKTESQFGLSADQIVLSMFAEPSKWYPVPLIHLGKNERIRDMVSGTGKRVPYKEFFERDGKYKLRNAVRTAYNMTAADRGNFEKEILKLDERINIMTMIFSGRIFKIIPQENDSTNTWLGAAHHSHQNSESAVAGKFFTAYKRSLSESIISKNFNYPDQLISELSDYQKQIGVEVIPSKSQLQFEILLNNIKVFNRLAVWYSLLGLLLVILMIISVFKNTEAVKLSFKILLGLAFLMFLFHTSGLGIRWYVSERAPWSNGYESLIYIAWTAGLAGFIFTRKSIGGIAATMILSGSILLVAMLSYLDPEITPLVPVLKSYWLTIHVSLIAGSYGFLMLGAIIGLINLIMMIFLNPENRNTIKNKVQELSLISEITLIAGLVMLSVGTYLGGVWANESWGRYWGWDAKETWALVTILVYAFILHMRLIPGLRGLYSFNLASLFGLASVIMTYFGVNYYLSGLHSYAAGDPIPIPNWVYISIISCAIVSVLAYLKYKRNPI